MLSEFLDLGVRNHFGLCYVIKFMILLFWSNYVFHHFSNFHIKISFMKDSDENIKNKINTRNLNFVAGS